MSLTHEKLFEEHFKNNDGKLDEKAINEYRNFNKIINVINDYQYGGTLDVLDEKQKFYLVLDIINAMED